MKRVLFVLITGMIILFLSPSDAEAAFKIELINYNSIDFGSMDMGAMKDDVPPDGLIVRCITSGTAPWTLTIQTYRPLTHTSNPAFVIPNMYFRWYGVSTSDSTNTSLVMTREDFTVEKTVYNGPNTETQTDITIKFELTLPPLLQSGTYTINVEDIIFTLTE